MPTNLYYENKNKIIISGSFVNTSFSKDTVFLWIFYHVLSHTLNSEKHNGNIKLV